MTFDKRLKLRQIASVICFLAGIGMISFPFGWRSRKVFSIYIPITAAAVAELSVRQP